MSRHKINLGDGPIDVTEGPDVNLDAEEFYFDGERLTEERAEQLGLESPNLGGRPHLDPERKPSTHVAFRVSQPVADKLDGVVRASGRRRSDILRQALQAYLESVG